MTNAQVFKEKFDAGIPNTWAVFDNGVGTGLHWNIWKYGTPGSNVAYIMYDCTVSTDAEDWLVTPLITPNLEEHFLKFDQGDPDWGDFGSKMSIRISTSSQTDKASFTTIYEQGEKVLTPFLALQEIDLSAYIDTPIYIAFVMTQNCGDRWLIDNVEVATRGRTTETKSHAAVDAKFEAIMVARGYDYWPNGVFGPNAKVANVKSLDLSNENLQSLEGIEHFTALESLTAKNNHLEIVDLSKNKNLKYVNLEYNQLKSLHVHKNTQLEELYLKGNKLKEIALDSTPNLKSLELMYNQIETLDLRYNRNLEYVGVKENGTLQHLLLARNNNLKQLIAGFNALQTIDLSNSLQLKELELNDNNLTGYIDLTPYTQLEAYNLCNNNLDAYPGDECKGGYPAPTPNPTQFSTLEAYMVFKGWDLDGVANGSIVASRDVPIQTTLSLSGVGLTDVTGIAEFVALEELFLGGNNLKTIDISRNKALTTLSVKGNQLTNLDLTANTRVSYVEAQVNQLDSLRIGQQNALKTLYIQTNKLTSLALSKAIHLETLNASTNQLMGTLDLSKNTKLHSLLLANNALEILQVKNTQNRLITNDNFNIRSNPNLSCVVVDDVDFSKNTWVSYVEDSSVFTTNEDCRKLVTTPESELKIINNQIQVGVTVVKLKIYTQSGIEVPNKDLKGLYFVKMIDKNGFVSVRRILIE